MQPLPGVGSRLFRQALERAHQYPTRQRFYRSASAFVAAPAIGSPELQLKIIWEELLKRKLLTQVMAEPERVYSSVVIGYATLPVRISA